MEFNTPMDIGQISQINNSNDHLSKEDSMDPNVLKYVQLHHRKTLLLKEKFKIDAELKKLNPIILNISEVNEDCDFEISPTEDEIKDLGDFGALQVKVKNVYQRVNKDSITDFCTKFFGMLIPDGNEEDIKKLGLGQSEWIWSNRTCEPVKYIERTYLTKFKRKCSSEKSSSPNPTKRNRKTRNTNYPKTRDDFVCLEAFEQLSDNLMQ